jgi:DNA-binding transcriptional LysR family regulator
MYSSPAYLALHAAPQTLQDLVEHEFIGHQTQQRDGVLSLKDSGRARRLQVRHRIVVNSIRLARDLVVSGLGLAVLPHALCRSYVESGALVRVLPAWKCPPVQATAVVLARNGIPRKTRAFLDFVAERLRREEDQR